MLLTTALLLQSVLFLKDGFCSQSASYKSIKHIKARVKHPQSNGKVEKLFATLRKLKKHFETWDATVVLQLQETPHEPRERETSMNLNSRKEVSSGYYRKQN